MVGGAANYLLKQVYLNPSIPSPKVGNSRIKCFVNHHPQYFKRKQKPLAAERDNAHDINSMIKHFEAYQAVQTKRGIADEDTWNMDETGFWIRCGQCYRIISTHWQQPFCFSDPDNCDYISFCECISTKGQNISSMLILSGKQTKIK